MRADQETVSPAGPSLLRNVSWLGMASVIVKPFWLAFTLSLAPRILGVEGYGTMQTALAFAGLSLSFADLGTTNHTLREVARDHSQGSLFFANVLGLRFATLGVGVTVALAAALIIGHRGDAFWAVAAALGFVAGQSLAGLGRSFFRAHEDLRPEAVATVIERVTVIAVGLAFLVATRSASWTLAGMALAMGAVAAVQFKWISRRLVPLRKSLLNRSFAYQTARLALPLGAADVLLSLYFRTDQVMVEAMLDEAAAGQYGQAFRLLEALSLLPAILVQSALFSRLARLSSGGDSEAFRITMLRGAGVLGAASVAVSVTLFFGADFLIDVLTGDPEFAPAADVLRVLAWTFPFTCMKDLLYVSFLARRRHRLPIFIFGVALVANVSLNAFAIPTFGIVGAAAVTVGTEVCIVIFFIAASLRRP